ncbi:GerAB/ArcD/ProY family transporter [Anaerobacillus sp. CMMVII]|uniref:GerAB/ArcD/ProY family transporter n=1 Tax=Anaerobacillus sp. CMMVII TaxID=2755588 RepID=UPI0021B7F052|nr:spore germination protein [Anaerobacillus sp. CMMVII]MCT8138352.1 GerAB/ArcD/ProY family transporter [Anaerobacillus sp. CMMVII]
MMEQNKSSITLLQMTFFIIQTQIGIGILSMPYSVFSGGAAGDSWMAVLLAGVVIQMLILLFWKLSKRFPSSSFFDILPKVFGRSIGKLLIGFYMIYFLLVVSLIFILFNSIIDIWAFPQTPNWIFLVMLGILVYYLVIENLRIIARFHTLVSVFLLSIVLLTLPVYTQVDIRYIMPVFNSGFTNFLSGGKEAIFSLLGFELVLFLFPFVKGNEKEKLLYASAANGFVTLFYTYLTFLCTIFFSPEELRLVPHPVLYMLNAFTFTVIERTDIVFLSIWMILVTTSLMSYSYFAAMGLAKIIPIKKQTKTVAIILICASILSLIPRNVLSIDRWSTNIGNLGIIFSIVLPVGTLLLSYALRRLEGKVKV